MVPRPPALQVNQLSKAYGRPVVDDLGLTVERGEIYALLGPNGAGKTTTLKMCAGLLKPDFGRIWIAGHDMWKTPVAAKRELAFLPDEALLYDQLTVWEMLEFMASLFELEPATAARSAQHWLNAFALDSESDARCESLSRGQRQKVALIGALMRKPQLYILDEPLTGLDAASARDVKDVLHARVAEGASVVVTTHILEVAERLANRIGIIHHGKLLAEGTLEELRVRSGRVDGTLEDIFLSLTGER